MECRRASDFARAGRSPGLPGTRHGFNNGTTPRYDEAARKLAWQRTVDFFNTHLRG